MDTSVVEIAVQTMIICAKLCSPILIMSLAVGLAVSLFQSVTQIQEQTLSFVPKAIGVGVALLLSGESHGYLQPCGCSEPQKGGLARRYNSRSATINACIV